MAFYTRVVQGGQSVFGAAAIKYRLFRAMSTTSHDAQQAKPYEEIPGPNGLRTMLDFSPIGTLRGDRFNLYLSTRHEQYGKIFKEKLEKEFVFTCDPNDIRAVYRSEGKFPNHPNAEPIMILRKKTNSPHGIIGTTGEDWYRTRQTINHIARPKVISSFVSVNDEICQEFIQRLRGKRDGLGQVPNFEDFVVSLSFETIVRITFGIKLGCLQMDDSEESTTRQALKAMKNHHKLLRKLLFALPLYKHVPTPTWYQYVDAYNTFYGHTSSMAATRMSELKRDLETGSLVEAEGDLVSACLMKSKIPYERLLAASLDFFLSVDGIANSVMFCLYALAQNPAAQESLFKEIRDTIPHGQPITEAALNKMHYLRAVTKETFRLFPVIALLFTILEDDVVLSGYRIPAGKTICMSTAVASRLPEYFDDPDSFKPERWLRESHTQGHKVNPFIVMPFGHGLRMCPGRRMAEQVLYVTLIKALQNFRVEHDGDIGVVYSLFGGPDKPTRFAFLDRDPNKHS